MANPFMTDSHEEIETALLLERATQVDLSTISPEYENAVAFTDGTKVFINSDDRLAEILPAYNHGMLKWLLWHEEFHMQLKHHNRFFRYLSELRDSDCEKEFQVSKSEVNIIMDILVHDSLSKMFPDLVETAVNNLAQMRNRNSLMYTFKTFTLEDMLEEYRKHKRGDDTEEKEEKEETESDSEEETEDREDSKTVKRKAPSKADDKKEEKKDDDKTPPKGSKDMEKKGHSEETEDHDDMSTKDAKDVAEDDAPEVGEDKRVEHKEPEPEHDKTDWSKLEEISDKEFIDEDESDEIKESIERLKRKKMRLSLITETLNGLATSQRARSFAVPSYISVGHGVMLKGRKPAKTPLYIIFDASGSMGSELETFKEVISKSIPQALNMPCEWFAGCNNSITPYKREEGNGYYKGTFKDIMQTWASNGYADDGDRVIDLCLKAEEQGYSPIGVTDGGGRLSHISELKKLKRTILVGQNDDWLEHAKKVNPMIQTLYI